MNKKEIKGCVHPEDSWTNYGCGDCGEKVTYNGCRGPRGNGEKEMIEEIQSILPNIEVIKVMYSDIDFARYLYDHNCRKITDGLVVLSKAEYAELQKIDDEQIKEIRALRQSVGYWKERTKMWRQATYDIRKETARAILKIIKEEYDYIGDLERIIAKQFGVEVEE